MSYLINKSSNLNKTQKTVFISLLLSQAIVLSYLESFIPINVGIPGVKLGLANIITLTSLYFLNFKEVLSLIVLRVLITSSLTSFSAFPYSLAGAIFSFLIMFFLISIAKDKFSTVGISIIGAVFHNIGQLFMAGLIIRNFNIIFYLPFLMISAIFTGILVGTSTMYIVKLMNRLKYFR